MKFAATILALALATTHGLDDGHNVQKKDASKGLRGSAEADSSLERAAVGRKLDFGYHSPDCPQPSKRQPDPRVYSFCSNDETQVYSKECRFYAVPSDCTGEEGTCSLKVDDYVDGCDDQTCRCCDGSLPFADGSLAPGSPAEPLANSHIRLSKANK